MAIHFPTYSDDLILAWKQGILDFNEGRYWHAHESWEQGWKTLPEPEKTYLQALIQFAAVFHLLEKGRDRPARSLCISALDKLSRTESIRETLPRIEIRDAERILRAIQADPGTRPEPKAVLLLPPAV